MIKDSLGSDISKLSVPVYFNGPLSLLQSCCLSMEYNEILDRAAEEPDQMRRLALMAVYGCTGMSPLEMITTKPFNPILGETYEYVCDRFSYVAE